MRTREKQSWRDLAVFGGSRLFDEPLHVNKPNLANSDHLHKIIDGMLARRWFSDGQLVREFEGKVARLAGVRHCVAICNGTLGLEMTVRALNITGEVIIPSFTFVATAQALCWLNLTPVFCDVDPRTHNIDPAHVERLITPRTQAILGVHLWGQPCDIETLTEIAEQHRIPLIFDAAHALGSSYRGRPVGSFGRAEVFSFHATKFVNTGEGGAITTDDADLAARLRAIQRFGFDSNDQVTAVGTNGKMSEIAAAMGLPYLDSFDELMAANLATYRQYETALAGISGVSLLSPETSGQSNCQYIVTVVDEMTAKISRDELLQVLQAENILVKRYFHPGCHRMVPLVSANGPQHLPVTERLVQTVLVLPGGASIESREVRGVCDTIRLAVKDAAQIREALANRSAGKGLLEHGPGAQFRA